MAQQDTEVAFIARVAVPIVLGLLLGVYILDATVLRGLPEAAGIYTGLIVVSLVLIVSFAGLLIYGLFAQGPLRRLWAIYLGVTVVITILGVALNQFVAQPAVSPGAF